MKQEKHNTKADSGHTGESVPKKKKANIIALILVILIVATISIGAVIYLKIQNSRVYVENSELYAPIITLSPSAPGVLDRLFVKQGDSVRRNMVVAQVNSVPIMAKTDGIVISVTNTPGQLVSAQTAVVSMIDPNELAVIGHVGEDKGLKDIKQGQYVLFVVDAFPKKEYTGYVSSISPSARQSDIVFSISDKRQQRQFDVKVKFDIEAYPELKNGMSAKMWIYT